MARVEELPDDFDKSLNLNPVETAPAHSVPPPIASASIPFAIGDKLQAQDGTTPALPPHMASVRSHTADEIVQMMNRTPLFMTSIGKTQEEGMRHGNYIAQGSCSSHDAD